MIKQIKYNPKVIQKRPMVTPTKVQASEIRVKEGMVEVKNIFQRVDHAFKKRKNENEVLAQEIIDLENHVAYLEKQTLDQVQATTSINISLSSVQARIQVCVKENIVINDKLNELHGLMEVFNNSKQRIEATMNVIASSHMLLCKCRAEIKDRANTCREESETYQIRLEDLSTLLAERTTEVNIMEDDSKKRSDKLKDLREQEKLLDEAKVASTSAITDMRNRKEVTRRVLAEVQETIARSDHRLIALAESKEKLHMAAATRQTAFSAQMQLRDEELSAAEAEQNRLFSTCIERKKELCSAQNRHKCIEATVLELTEKIKLFQQSSVKSANKVQEEKMLVDSLKESVRVTEMELKEVKCTLKEVEAANKDQYELTCVRMTELRDLHQRHAAATFVAHEENKTLSQMVEKLKLSVDGKKKDAEKMHDELILMRNQALQQHNSVMHIRSEVQEKHTQLASKTAQARQQCEDITEAKAKMHLVEKNEKREQQLAIQLDAGESELRSLREKNSQVTQTHQRTIEEIATIKRSIATAKKDQKKKKGSATRESILSEECIVQINLEVEQETQEICREIKAQHTQDIAAINECRAKLARGFPGQGNDDTEIQLKEEKIAALREMVQNEREIQKWRVQKREQEMQAKIEATHTVKASLDECDAFPFYAPVQPDLSDETEKDQAGIAPPPMLEPTTLALTTPITGIGMIQIQRQLTPPHSGLSQWELSEPAPASALPPLPRTYAAVCGITKSTTSTEQPVELVQVLGPQTEEKSTCSHPSQSSSARKHKRRRSNKQRKSPPHSSETSSFDPLKPQSVVGTSRVSSQHAQLQMSQQHPPYALNPVDEIPHNAGDTPSLGIKNNSITAQNVLDASSLINLKSKTKVRHLPTSSHTSSHTVMSQLTQQAPAKLADVGKSAHVRPSVLAAPIAPNKTRIGHMTVSKPKAHPTTKRLPFPSISSVMVSSPLKETAPDRKKTGKKQVAPPDDWFSEDAPF